MIYSLTGIKGPRIMFLIKSALPHFERRIAIRETWGSEQRLSGVTIRTAFFLGTWPDSDIQSKIDEEESEFGDIIQADFQDIYGNLGHKKMSGFKWAFDHCPGADFFVFTGNQTELT